MIMFLFDFPQELELQKVLAEIQLFKYERFQPKKIMKY